MYVFSDPAAASTRLAIDGRYRLKFAGRNEQGEECYVPQVGAVPFMRRANSMGFSISGLVGNAWSDSLNCAILPDGIPQRFAKVPEISMRHIVPAEFRRNGYGCEVAGFGAAGFVLRVRADEATFEKLLAAA